MNSLILGTTDIVAKIYGFKSMDHTIGKTYVDIPCNAVKCADIFLQQDREIEQERLARNILEIQDYYTGFAAYNTIKSPIINPSTNNVLGTYAQGVKLEINFGLKAILDIYGTRFSKYSSMYVCNSLSKFKLTEVERDILFCICLGISRHKDIAHLLSAIYKRNVDHSTTVNDTFRRLYRKLDCNTPTQLLEFAIYNNLHLQIPSSFLPTGSYILNCTLSKFDDMSISDIILD